MRFCLLLLAVNLYLCAGDDSVEQAFKSNEIVPDLVDKAPHEELEVKYETTKKKVSLGNKIAPKDVREIPDIDYVHEDDDKSLYTLAMVDPDAPSRENPKERSFLHWLVVNIPEDDVDRGDTIGEYVGSGPPKDTGLHRYVFLIYKQPGKIEVDEPRLTKTHFTGRPSFSIKKFAEKYKLGEPIAGNFYQAEYDDSVPELHKQLKD